MQAVVAMSFSAEAANQVFEENFAVNLRSLLDPVQDETAAELGAKIAAAWVNTLLELEKLERELKKLNDQSAATSDKEEKSKLIERLSKVEK